MAVIIGQKKKRFIMQPFASIEIDQLQNCVLSRFISIITSYKLLVYINSVTFLKIELF